MAILNQKLMLIPTIEIIQNEDGEFFLLDQESDRHFKINKQTAILLDLIKKEPLTGNQLLNILKEKYTESAQMLEEKLQTFIQQLIRQGVINSEENSTNEIVKPKVSRPILKLKLFSDFSSISVKENKNLLGIEMKKTISFVICYFLIGLFFITFCFNTVLNNYILYDYRILLFAIPLLFIHIFLHELTHIIICKKMGGEIKEAGIGLLYYFIPVGYVTYKETFRLSKISRAKIAIAGPIFDVAAITITIILLSINLPFTQILFPLFILQFSMLLFNLNLLVPSDLFRFIENISGQYNFRRKALSYLIKTVTGKAKNSYELKLSRKKKAFYFIYTILSITYITILFIWTFSMFRYFF